MVEKRSFEENLARLEEIASQLENGDLPLDDALAAFEEGIALVKLCGRRLRQAEKKVSRLTQMTLKTIEAEEQNSR